MQVDFISDIHIDSWVRNFYGSTNTLNLDTSSEVQELVDRLFSNGTNSELLLLAGDLGNNNKDSLILLNILSKMYKVILLVPGNHDYYLLDTDFDDSLVRWRSLVSELPSNIKVLNGTTFEYEGIVFGGTGGWYDFSYGVMELGLTLDRVREYYEQNMNDFKYIHGVPAKTVLFAQSEKEKLQGVLAQSDVILTHVGPSIPDKVPFKYMYDISNSLFYFDAGRWLYHEDFLRGKTWFYGHIHERRMFDYAGCTFVNNAVGYVGELSSVGVVTVDV